MVYDIVTYLAVTCDSETSVAEDDQVTLIKGLQETVSLYFKVRGVKFIICTENIAEFRMVPLHHSIQFF